MGADMVLVGFTTLVLAGLIAGCLRKSNPGEGSAGGSRGGQQGGRRGPSSSGKPAPAPRRDLSPVALQLQKELGVPVGSAVTVSTLGVLLEKADGGGFVVIEEAVGVLKALIELADVFLINEVGDEAESAQALQKLRETGCLLAKEASQQQERGVAEHKVLFCSTAIGRQAIVRQLRPQLHVDRDEELMQKLVPHIARLVRVDPSFSARPDSVPYRVLPALKALLPASS